MKELIAIWGTIGAIIGFVKVLIFGGYAIQAVSCASSLNTTCMAKALEGLILFGIHVALGPLLLLPFLIQIPFIGGSLPSWLSAVG